MEFKRKYIVGGDLNNGGSMKFKHNHTPGPWTVTNCGPHWDNKSFDNIAIHYGSDGEHIVDHVYDAADADLISQAPSMRDYLIELAKNLEEEIDMYNRCRAFKTGCRRISAQKQKELDRIIGILTAAGVEVELRNLKESTRKVRLEDPGLMS